jgi:hypothetical protein
LKPQAERRIRWKVFHSAWKDIPAGYVMGGKRKIRFFVLLLLVVLVACQRKPVSLEETVQAGSSSTPAATADSDGLNRPSPFHKSLTKPVVQIPAGSAFVVRLNQTIDTRNCKPGDRFSADLDAPILVGETSILPAGTPVSGHIVSAKPSGRLKGRGYLSLTLDSFQLNGKTHLISTSSDSWSTGAHKKRNVAIIGGGSGLGALIGGLASGGGAALIGAGAGAAAGTAGAALTGRKNVHLSAETRVRFTLKAPVRLQG